MRVLAIDTDSNSLDLLMRAQHVGHQVRWFDRVRKGREPRAGEGIVPKIKEYDAVWSKWIDWADLIYIPGNNYYMEKLEGYRALGYPIYGGNVHAAKWESDRALGQAIMKKCGLKIIPGEEFHDYESAIAYVKRHGKPFVSKPSGEADKALSYVSNSAADLIYMLDRWSKNEKYVAAAKEHGFILQEKKIGCEMGAGGWFGPFGWAPLWEEDWEYKKLMDGDLGVNTGEQGTLVRFVRESKLAEEVVKPLTKELRSIGYCGCVNVNCIIDDAGVPWPLEFTMRDGWPATHNHAELHEGDPVQWMLDAVQGRWTRSLRENECSISVVMSIPDYPYSRLTGKDVEGIPIYGVSDHRHIHLCEVMLGESPTQMGAEVVTLPCYQTAGDYVLVATGSGDTITGARRSAYAALDKISIPNSPSYRKDIGKGKLVEALPKIQKLGYAKGLTY